MKCQHCGSRDTLPLFHEVSCLVCGRHTPHTQPTVEPVGDSGDGEQ